MHLVVELFFDEDTERAIRAVWQKLLAIGASAEIAITGARPHVSIAMYQELDLPRFRAALGAFAGERPGVDLSLASWGVFPTEERVAFLAPVVTRDLLALHYDFHREFAAFGAPSHYYLPANWVPHCTLATDVSHDLLPRVAEACSEVAWPMRGRIERIGLVEYRPRREHFTFSLGT